MTFYEVRAKSIINRVPSASRVPFEWTVNPYRGCTHACVYCLDGGTLAHADAEATQRAKQYLADLDVRSPDLDLPTVRRLVTWPRRPEADWTKGFLAGLFDAEGSYRQGVLSIVDPSPGTVDRTVRAMHALGFAVSIDVVRDRPKPPRVRLRGGLAEHLRFFQTVDPAVTGKRSMAGATVDSRVPVLTVEPLGVELPMVDITTGTGDFVANGIVSHNCFARNTHSYLDLDTGHDFDTRIVVKVNAGALLRRELAAPRWSGAPIAMGTNVDCYQRAEGRYRLMRDVLAALRDFANPYSILTKGTLILRDLDLLTQSAEVTSVGLAMSIGFVDEALWRSVEPGTPSPRRRLDVLRQLSDAGFGVGVLVAPILPGLSDSDESIDATVAALAAAGAAG